MASSNANYTLIYNVKCVKVVLRFERKYNDGMVNKIKTNKLSGFNFYAVWLIAVATFCMVAYVLTSLMGSPFLYIPGFIAWGLLLYCAVMILSGNRVLLLVLGCSYAILSAATYILSLGAVGFLDTNDSGAYATIVGQFCFVIFALIFAFTLKYVYEATSSARDSFVYRMFAGFLWVIVSGMALIGVSVIVYVPIYVMNSIDIAIPFTLFGLACMLIEIVSRKRIAGLISFITFIVLGAAATGILLQDPSRKQYLYVIASICILALLSLLLWIMKGVRKPQ